jgi:MYXO-CTERM domain-containing protein
VADFDGNGRKDVVVASDGFSSLALWEQDTLGQFGAVKKYEVPAIGGLGATGYGLQSLAAADVSGDGKPDLLVADMLEGLVVYYNSLGTVPTADLRMVVQYSPQPALVGSTTTIAVNVINDGPSEVGVTLVNFLPTLLRYAKSDRNCGFDQSAVICDLGRLASGGTTQVLITAVPERSQGTDISAYENVAFVEADEIDYFPSNNVDVTRLTISNPVAGQFRFEVDRMEVSESAGTINLKVLREGGSADGVFVSFNVRDVTTRGAVDWQGISGGQLVWNHGDATPKFITLSIVDDSIPEGDESLEVSLFNPTLGSLGTPAKLTVVIKDNDPPSSSTPPPPSASGGGGGGCSSARGTPGSTDPVLPVMVLAAVLGILRRRRTDLTYACAEADLLVHRSRPPDPGAD